MKTLIVEDDAKERLLFEEQIRLLGYDATSCSNAKEALNNCQQAFYGLIILDLGLPDMEGIELCRRIRALPQGKLRMILIITGREEPEILQQALDAGANDYLIKPVGMELLKVRLTIIEQQYHNLIRRKQAETALKESLINIERAKQEWESTADSLSQVICLLNRQGRIIRTNRAIELWNLGQVTEVKGRGIHEFFHPNCTTPDCYLKKFLRNAWEELSHGKPFEREMKDNYLQRDLNIQVRPVSTPPKEKGKPTESFAVLVASDITAHKQIEEALSRQDKLLLGVAGAMNYLLITSDFQTAVIRALQALGLAADVDRVYIFETHFHPETNVPLMSQRFEWNRFSTKAQINVSEFQNIPYSIGLKRWYETLRRNKTICGLIRNLPPSEQEFLASQNIQSILIVPISIQDNFWGFIGFDDCHSERQWRDEEEALLLATAGSIGGAIARKKMEEQLRRLNSELRAVFQSLPDEYFRLDANGSILDYKVEQGSDLYFYPETFIGKWASGLLPTDVERQFDTAIKRVNTTKKLVSIEYKMPTSEQKERYEEIRLLPFLDDQLIVVARDITERKLDEQELRKHRDHLEELVQERTAKLITANKQLQQEILKRKQTEEILRELNQKLEEASKHKSNFLASMSHELRTPLNAMIGYTSLTLSALKNSLSPKHLENLTKAEQSARILLQLINDVLDFSKIEAGKMDLFIEEIDLAEILEDVVIIAEGLLLEKSVELQSEITSNLPSVKSDYTKLKQILNNLVGNAIKFTNEGSVTVRAAPVKAETNIRIEIEDTGEGIPEEKLDHIFESFKQVDGSIKKRFGGTGLGLAISKKFCELLGISIGVKSQLGKGTTFWLEIPVQSDISESKREEEEEQFLSKQEESETPEHYAILLIDDDEMTLNLMEEIFTTAGHTVYKTLSGEEGVQLAVEHMPDVILLDLVMPDMDGFETMQALKEEPKIAQIPVIACSAVATKGYQEKATQAGCVGYITKPIEPERLIKQVRKNMLMSSKMLREI